MTKSIEGAIDKVIRNIGFEDLDPDWVLVVRTEALKEIEVIISEQVIGGGEVHVSHVCPKHSILCREFHARGSLRHGQRQALQAALYGKEAN